MSRKRKHARAFLKIRLWCSVIDERNTVPYTQAFDGKVEKVVGKGAMVWCKQDKKRSYIEAYGNYRTSRNTTTKTEKKY